MFKIYLYGLGGAKDQYRAIRYTGMADDLVSIERIINEANYMRMTHPNIEHVYVVDNRHGLRRDYMESIKRNTVESCALFKDILERDGIKVF